MARHTPGNYVPLDVNYARDVSIRKAGPNAELLFLRSLAYAKGARTSGFVSDFDLEVVAVGMRAASAAARKLVEVGLWLRVSEGWQIRSWERWNAEDQAVSAGGKLGNHVRWHVNTGKPDPSCEHCQDRPPIAPRSAPDSPPNPEGESQGKGREGKGTTTSSGDPDEPDGFAEFYAAYPRKEARGRAVKAWRTAIKRATPETIMSALESYAFSPERKYQPLPATWLNDQHWHDETPTAPLYDVNKLPEPGEGWSATQLDMVLGKDDWTVPEPPAGMDDDQGFMWQQQEKRRHFALRVKAAMDAIGRTA